MSTTCLPVSGGPRPSPQLTRHTSLSASLLIVLLTCQAWAPPLPVLAEPPQSSPAQPSPAQPGKIDVGTSRVYIFVGKSGLGHEHAIEGKLKSGRVKLGASQNAGEMVFDMQSFAADTEKAREYIGLEGKSSDSFQSAVTENMLGPQVLDVGTHPQATFKISSALPLKQTTKAGREQYRLDGQFTLHGVTKPLQFDAEVVPDRAGSRLRGAFTIRQTNFGVKPYSKAFGAIGVADELKIYGEILLAPSPATARRTGAAAARESAR